MQISKRFLVLFTIILIIIICFVLWITTRTADISEKYLTVKVKRGDVIQTVSASGTLNPVTVVTVGTQVSGKVQKLYADFNDHVTANQILLELDPTLLKANLNQSIAQFEKAKAAISLAKANKERGRKLLKSGYISKQDWQQLVQLYHSAAADVALTEADLTRNKASLEYAVIKSPVSGVVVDREVDVGQTVAASFQTPVLFKIAQDLNKMQIDANFAEADIGSIKPGQEANFSVDAFPDKNYKGVVKQIRLNPTVVQNVVTYDIIVSVDNKTGELLPGMTAYVNTTIASNKNVLLVPNAALRFRPKEQENKFTDKKEAHGFGAIYRLKDNKIELIRCRLGITDNRFTEVTSDKLKIGDVILVGEATDGIPSKSSRIRHF